MSEPMHEGTEEYWIEQLNRFDTEIYPLLFQARGYSKGEAYTLWMLASLCTAVDDLAKQFEDKGL